MIRLTCFKCCVLYRIPQAVSEFPLFCAALRLIRRLKNGSLVDTHPPLFILYRHRYPPVISLGTSTANGSQTAVMHSSVNPCQNLPDSGNLGQMTTTHTSLVARTAYFGTEQLSAVVLFGSRVTVCGLETALNVNFYRGSAAPSRCSYGSRVSARQDRA